MFDSPEVSTPQQTATHYALSGSSPQPSGGKNRGLLAALAIVTLIAIIVPVLMLAFLRTGDDNTVSTGAPEVDGDVSTDQADLTVPQTGSEAVAPTPDTAGAPAAPLAPAPTAVAPAQTQSTTAAAVAQPAAAPVIKQLTGESPAVFKVTGINAGSALNVRQSAGTTNPLIGTLANNATGIAGTGRRVSVDGSEWREIKYNNGTGWVFAGYLALAPAPAPAAATTPAPTPAPEVVKQLDAEAPGIFTLTDVATGASLNVRAEPGRTQRLVGTIPGTTASVPATGRRAQVGQTEWREIGFRDGTGWVDATYLLAVPEAPKTIQLPAVSSSTVGIVPLTSTTDRLVLRADPGYDKNVLGTVGASAVNIATTGRQAQIGTEVWVEINSAGTTGWVPRQLTIPVVRSASDVLASSGVAAVSIDKVAVAADGTVTVQVGSQTLKVSLTGTVTAANGQISSVADWANTAKTSSSPIVSEVTVAGNQVTSIWLAG